MKILVVDDNPDILEAVELIMTTEGYETRTLLSGNEVYAEALSFKPDLIILDYLLSGTDGRDICRDLKSKDETRNIPVIMISAHPSVEETVQNYGADGFLGKPFSVDELLNMVNEYTG